MNVRARQADCGKPTAARTPKRQTGSGKPTSRGERQTNCGPKDESGSPTAPGERQIPTAARRPTAAKPRGELHNRQRPEGQLRQSRLPPLKLNLNWTRGRNQQSSWARGNPRGRTKQSGCQQSPLARGVLRGRSQQSRRQQLPLEAWLAVAKTNSPNQQPSICSEFMCQTFFRNCERIAQTNEQPLNTS